MEKREPPYKAFECDKDDYAPLGKYLDKGFEEGYTVFGEDVRNEEIPEIVLRTDNNGKFVKLGICSYSKADTDAYSNFPLWQDYFQSCDDWYEKRKCMILEAARQIYEEAGRPVYGRKTQQ